MRINIIGAGYAGLIAGIMAKAAGYEVNIYEKGPRRTGSSHKAILRFRTDNVAIATGISFKRVPVLKAIDSGVMGDNIVAHSMRYALKTTGLPGIRSIAENQLQWRYIAPRDFYQQLLDRMKGHIHWETDGLAICRHECDFPCISTVAMPIALKHVGIKTKTNFTAVRGEVMRMPLWVAGDGAYATVYSTSMEVPFYRASLEGTNVVVEYALPEGYVGRAMDEKRDMNTALQLLGLENCPGTNFKEITTTPQVVKTLPIDENERINYIMHLTDQHNIYSLGRFACWRPGLLLDDIPLDVQRILRMISGERAHRYKWR